MPQVFLDKNLRWLAGARADGEGKHAERRNKKARDFTQPFIHKSTLLRRSRIGSKNGIMPLLERRWREVLALAVGCRPKVNNHSRAAPYYVFTSHSSWPTHPCTHAHMWGKGSKLDPCWQFIKKFFISRRLNSSISMFHLLTNRSIVRYGLTAKII